MAAKSTAKRTVKRVAAAQPAPATKYDCDALVNGSEKYFGPLSAEPELYELYVAGKAAYCLEKAAYQVQDVRCCKGHLESMLDSFVPDFVDGIIPLRVLRAR